MPNRSLDIKVLGVLDQPMLLFGGVYSNLHALKALMEIAEQAGIAAEQIICTGDVLGYCAHPQETVELIRSWGVHVIKGNVEQQLGDEAEDCGCDFTDGGACDMYSRTWYPFAQRALNAEAGAWMRDLPDHIRFEMNGRKAFVLHGGHEHISEFVFASTDWEQKCKAINDTQAHLVIAGHCGLPFTQLGNEGAWLNPGVIGMPANDGTPRVWYMKLEPKGGRVQITHHAFTYDHKAAASAMSERNLPAAYATTLSTGLWDNCEILPPQETQQQGVEIPLDGLPFLY